MSDKQKKAFDHIRKIMEEGYGERQADPCKRCSDRGDICWAYSSEGRERTKNASLACTHCRAAQDHCSLVSPRKKAVAPPTTAESSTAATDGNEGTEVVQLREENVVLRRQIGILQGEMEVIRERMAALETNQQQIMDMLHQR